MPSRKDRWKVDVLEASTPTARSMAAASSFSSPAWHTPTTRARVLPSAAGLEVQVHPRAARHLPDAAAPPLQQVARAPTTGTQTRKKPSRWVGCVANRSDVTTPKLPPPPPRHRPEQVSCCWSASTVRITPSAVTIVSETRRSQVSP